MELVIYGRPSSPDYPGHVALGQEGGAPFYAGYRFDPADLPPGVAGPAAIRAHLFTHAVPGNVEDETRFVRDLRAESTWLEKRSVCAADLRAALPPPDSWDGFALYSFNPDTFDTPAARCFNCVTWAVEVAGALLPGFLTPVRQGRMKLIIQQLTRAGASS